MNALDETRGSTDLSDRAHPQEETVAHRRTREGKQEALPAPTAMAHPQLTKAPTGIGGLDVITQGGLPAGRPTLVCGGAGSGITFLVEGILKFGDPGVLVSFEERPDELAANVQSLGYDLHSLQLTKKLVIDYVRIERSEIEETGEYDLEGLFIRLGYAIDSIGARRVTLDTIEALFSGLSDLSILRAELRRLFLWLKEKGVTAVITGERGEGQLTRHGLEEYVSDCVILLENRVHNQIMTRTLRVVKYRGSTHGTNEYPFLIDDQGISVLPITSVGLQRTTSEEVISTGVAGLDAMLGAKGYFRGSSVLMSGAAGTGKTIFAARFAEATCERGERSLFFALEESPEQIMRNVRSVGIDLQKHVDAGLLRFEAARPTLYGFEMHLARMNRDIDSFRPATTIIDPISAFRGTDVEVHSILLRMIDLLKSKGITAVLTRLLSERELAIGGDQGISSIIDTWISLIDIESDGERNRGVYLFKSRGMGHSNQIREYQITDGGLRFFDIYRTASGKLLRGSARERAEASLLEKRRLKAPLRRRSPASKGKGGKS
jgi:circadian clock protein KaiC